MGAEAVAVSCVRGVQDEGSSCSDGLGLSAVHDVRGQKAQPGVTMMGVVGVEEADAKRPRVLLGGAQQWLKHLRLPFRTKK